MTAPQIAGMLIVFGTLGLMWIFINYIIPRK